MKAFLAGLAGLFIGGTLAVAAYIELSARRGVAAGAPWQEPEDGVQPPDPYPGGLVWPGPIVPAIGGTTYSPRCTCGQTSAGYRYCPIHVQVWS